MNTNRLSPHIRNSTSVSSIYGDIFAALVPPAVLAFVYCGWRAFFMLLFSILGALLFEMIFCFFEKRDMSCNELYTMTSAAIIALFLPAAAPLWLAAIGSAAAVIVTRLIKLLFGRTVLNPAAVGLALLFTFFGKAMSQYPSILQQGTLPILQNGFAFTPENSLLQQLKSGITPQTGLLDLLLGRFAGPLGTTPIMVLISCAVFLIYRHRAYCQIILPYLTVCAAMAFLFVRTDTSRLMSVVYELSAGSVLFCGIFIVSDPTASSKTFAGRIFFGAGCGLLVMLLRYLGIGEASCIFAVLLMNIAAKPIDLLLFKFRNRTAKVGHTRPTTAV